MHRIWGKTKVALMDWLLYCAVLCCAGSKMERLGSHHRFPAHAILNIILHKYIMSQWWQIGFYMYYIMFNAILMENRCELSLFSVSEQMNVFFRRLVLTFIRTCKAEWQRVAKCLKLMLKISKTSSHNVKWKEILVHFFFGNLHSTDRFDMIDSAKTNRMM